MTPLLPLQAPHSTRRRARRPALAAITAGLTLAVAACSSVSSYAATVDGTRIGTGTLENELRDIGSNDKYLKLVESQVQAPVRTNGVFDASFTSTVLSREIIYDLVAKDLARRKIVVTPKDLAAAKTSASDRIGGDDVFNAFPKSYQDILVNRTAEVTLLSFALIDKGPPDVAAKAYYDANQDAFAQACVSHILVASEDEANKAKARIDAGEAFATVAQEVSTDTGSKPKGGDLGCFGKQNQLVPEFSQAMFSQAVGAVGAPVKTQFGYHIILVKSREVSPYEKVVNQARDQAATAAQDKLAAWADENVGKANISINPKYGRWDKQGAQSRVVPPEAPTTKGTGAGAGRSGQPDQAPATTVPG
ncbi:MAG: peptidylprolyl isomerase [Actinomycetota bacterium]|nr:peptidylprolyl isomerase [Actinomycetota bacterium]